MRRHFAAFVILLMSACAPETTVSTDTAMPVSSDTALTDTAPSTTTTYAGLPGRRPRPDIRPGESSGSLTSKDFEELRRMLQDGGLGSKGRAGNIAALEIVQPIAVLDDDGSTVQISSGPKIVVAQMATWCPYSKQYMQFLKDPATQQKLRGYTFVFLFEKDEWPTVERHVRDEAKEHNLTETQIRARLKELKAAAGYGPVFDPAFLDELPGKHYFLASKSSVFGKGFPSIYDPSVRQCSLHPVEVFPYLMQQTEFRTLWRRYDPQNS